MIGRLSVGGRLAAGFAVLMVLSLVQGGVSTHYLAALNERIEQIYAREVTAMSEIAQAKSDLYRMRLDGIALATGADAQSARELGERIAKNKERLADWARRHGAAATGAVEQKLSASFVSHFETFAAQLQRAAQSRAPLSREGERAFDKADALLSDVVSFNDHSALTRQQYAIADYGLATQILIGLGVVIFALSAVIAAIITRSVTRPLRTVVEAADRVASGDLTVQLRTDSRDELGQVLQAMQNMAERLAGLVQKVRDGSNSIGAAAARLSQASTELAARTEQQASSLEETASSVEEITATVRQNSEHSSHTHALIAATRESAANGAAAMDAVVSNMEATYAAAQKIAGISRVIGDIAFQTNILSLNAAVEAARAGERGQGFAVVAAEVRSLAGRSAEAARDVKVLIDDSLQKVGAGKGLVGQAVGKMNEIAAQVKKASEVLEEIALASTQQGEGISQVNDTMTEIDQITQGNLTSVEETAAAARTLEESASMLAAAVDVFKLKGAGRDRAIAPDAGAQDVRQQPAAGRYAA